MREEDFSVEDQEAGENYFAKQAGSEFQSTLSRLKREARKGRLAFLRSIGRKERLKLSAKHGRRWQEAVSA